MFRSTQFLTVLAVLACLALAMPAISATWDITNDYSTGTQTSPWSYGYRTNFVGPNENGSTFTAYSAGTFTAYTAATPGIYWWTNFWNTAKPDIYGAISKNTNGTVYNTAFPAGGGYTPGTPYLEPGQVFIHVPYASGGGSTYSNSAICRWTAPQSYSAIKVHAVFTGQTPTIVTQNTGANVYVLYKQGIVGRAVIKGFVGRAVNGYTDSSAGKVCKYTVDHVIYNVAAGDTIEFSADEYKLAMAGNNNNQIGLVAQLDPYTTPLGTVSGHITSGGSGLNQAKVYAVGTTAYALTDGAGAYSLQLAPGSYTLRAIKQSYKGTATASPVAITDGGTATQDIALDANYWSVSDDFQLTNPNGAWSYGYKTGTSAAAATATFVQTTATWTQSDFGFVAHRDALNVASSALKGYLVYNPLPYTVVGGNDNTGANGIRYMANTTEILEPNMALAQANVNANNRAVYRWTSTVTGTVEVNVLFTGQDKRVNSQATVEVVKNSTVLFNAQLNGFVGSSFNSYTDSTGTAGSKAYTAYVQVAASDTLDFQVSNNYFAGVKATIGMSNTPGTLSGVVTSSLGGPVAGATVTIVGSSVTTSTASDGSYSFSLLPGAYNVQATAPLYADSAQFPITITPNNTTNQPITLVPYAVISGVVSDASGPLAGATVKETTNLVTTTSGPDGSYTLRLPTGTYSFSASAALHDPQTVSSIGVSNGTTTTQNFTLTTSYISGRVYAASSPTTNIQGAVVKTSDGAYSAVSDSAGNYSIQLPSGTYTVQAIKVNYVTGTASVVVPAATNFTQDFGLNVGWTWDLATDYGTAASTNGAGAWTYGYYDTGSGTFTKFSSVSGSGQADGTKEAYWTAGYPSTDGLFIKNITGSSVERSPAPMLTTYHMEGGKVAAYQFAGMRTDAKFTAPFGVYAQVTAKFTGQSKTAPYTTSNVWLAHGGVPSGEYWVGTDSASGVALNGFVGSAAKGYTDSFCTSGQVVTTYTTTLELGKDDTIDAVVGGDNTGYTGVELTVSLASDAAFVMGTVTSNLAGNPPLDGATVTLLGPSSTYVTSTGTDGAYLLAVKPNETYDMLVQKSLYDDSGPVSVPVTTGYTTRNAQLNHKQEWDYALDFSSSRNPNGQWSYGCMTSTANFSLYDYYPGWGQNFDLSALGANVAPAWQLGLFTDANTVRRGWGAAFKYNGASPYKASTAEYLALEPGMAGLVAAGSGAGTAIRWTSTDTRLLDIDIKVTGQVYKATFDRNTKIGVHVKKNGADVALGQINGFQGTSTNNYTDSAGSAPVMTYATVFAVNSGDVLEIRNDAIATPAELGIKWSIKPATGVTSCYTVQDLKNASVGSTVMLLTPKTIVTPTTAYADKSFFIEDDDRSQAMKLYTNDTMPSLVITTGSAGSYKITFAGKVVLDENGDKAIQVQSFNSTVPAPVLNPLGTSSKALSSSWRLVKVWGKLKEKVDNTDSATNTNWPYLYWTISDGGQDVKVPMIGQAGWMNTALLKTTIQVGDYISLTCIARKDSTGTVVAFPWVDVNFNDYGTF